MWKAKQLEINEILNYIFIKYKDIFEKHNQCHYPMKKLSTIP